MILLLNHISYPRWEMGLGHIAWICDNSLRQASLSRATKPLMAMTWRYLASWVRLRRQGTVREGREEVGGMRRR